MRLADEIDIEDTMNVLVKYDNNVTMAYSVNAFNAWEGYHIAFNGTKGRLEHTRGGIDLRERNEHGARGIKSGGVKTTIIPMRGQRKM